MATVHHRLRPVAVPPDPARVCRTYGCAAAAAARGLCGRCLDGYERHRACDELRLAHLAEALAARHAAPSPTTPLDRELALQVAAEQAFDAHRRDGCPWRRALVALLADCANNIGQR